MRIHVSAIRISLSVMMIVVLGLGYCLEAGEDASSTATFKRPFMLKQSIDEKESIGSQNVVLLTQGTILATSYKNNSLPLEEAGDDIMAMLSMYTENSNNCYQLSVLNFDFNSEEWSKDVTIGISPTGSPEFCNISVSLVNGTTGNPNHLYVFLGYGYKRVASHVLWYIFEYRNQSYVYTGMNGEFDHILQGDEIFSSMTVAPHEKDDVWTMALGYSYRNGGEWRSGFSIHKISFDGQDIVPVDWYEIHDLQTGDDHHFGILYMGVIEVEDGTDLVVLLGGPLTSTDDVLLRHLIGKESNRLRTGYEMLCGDLRDHPYRFARVRYDEYFPREDIAIVRGGSYDVGKPKFVRYAVEKNTIPVPSFAEYKMELDEDDDDYHLNEIDAGLMTNDNNDIYDDLVVIWEGTYLDGNEKEERVVQITLEDVPDSPANCLDIKYDYSFLEDFDEINLNDCDETKQIRHTLGALNNYFLSLFYQDTHGMIRCHTVEYLFGP